MQNVTQYGMNYKLDLGNTTPANVRLTQINRTTEVVLFGDKTEIDFAPMVGESGNYLPSRRHGGDAVRRSFGTRYGQANFGFVDGHVAGLRQKEFTNAKVYDYTKK